MAIGYRSGVSILLLIFYFPALAIAILLTIRHGIRKSAGWRFMIIFTLARILCACFQLATINQPKNLSLYVGYSVLIGIAVSPLELVAFGYVHFYNLLSKFQGLGDTSGVESPSYLTDVSISLPKELFGF